jgi:hypothetical protein
MNLTAFPSIPSFPENEMNLIALGATIAVVLTSLALSSCRNRIPQNQPDKMTHKVEELTKRLEASEANTNICLANLNALMLNLAALHKARVIRNDTRRRYNDTRRSPELVAATHRAEMNYKQAKDFLSSYVIEATKV